MLKKFLIASSILATTTSIALANPAPYIGAGLSIIDNTSRNSSAFLGNYRGIPVNLFAGYGGVVSENFYLAGELDGTITTAKLNNTGGLKSTYAFGLSALPGIMLSDHTLAFARVGVNNTRFSQLEKNMVGGKFGAGMQTSLTQNVDLRGEYDYTIYRTAHYYGSKVKPQQDAFNVSLIYKID